ncbi:sugar ABC transporter substrate-binding protein [Lederbergia wuyishanensis]|uniref:Ribose transport system substrate-binding protein n=1 Tax=Lederbergia wuyishanensis TaxID=1347903 RepID=A0ABU0D2Q4_9BACI|nr:substrate-binding domain-containing protein [Lederbergia wuyishanensis]MCJ8007174.1 substrate-binding domain-containing protein [Lederbergia wuyishanensis]MDQ0342681.1 ribose transport system substrate-binding protein [Lederbergia wuyishanensis]
MRRLVILILGFVCVVLFYFTIVSGSKVFKTDWESTGTTEQVKTKHRLVLITQELETPFWDKVAKGALEQAKNESASLEVWESYGNNQEDFLKKIEIAIYSQVDGIIVQGLDTDEFKALTKIKAASYGIPIITVANDVPMEESLRKSYVGSDQYLAGRMIGDQLIADMGTKGEVAIMIDIQHQYFQEQRLKGIKDVLKNYPSIQTIEVETHDTREQIITNTKDVLNKNPNLDAFIAINAEILGAMIQEIETRSQIEPYFIYSCDDNYESTSLLKQGKIDGFIEQSPEEMGTMSVKLLLEWLNNEKVPLDLNGYQTDIRVVKAMDVR